MKITSRDSIGLTIRFSWRELGFLRLVAVAAKPQFKDLGFQDLSRFCTALLNKIATDDVDEPREIEKRGF